MNNSAFHRILLHTWQLLNDARKSCKNSNYMLHFARKNCLSLRKYPAPPAMSTTPRMKLIVVPQKRKICNICLLISVSLEWWDPQVSTLWEPEVTSVIWQEPTHQMPNQCYQTQEVSTFTNLVFLKCFLSLPVFSIK